MIRILSLIFILSLFSIINAVEKKPKEENAAPIKALYVVGGGYHDYKARAPYLTENIAKHGKITFETMWVNTPEEVEKFADPKFGNGVDVIIYDICHADLTATAGVKAAMKLIENGKPAVMLHCAMHCFWQDETWAQCCGLLTRGHEAYQAFGTFKAKPEHPIASIWPADWKTEGDELYQNIKFPFPVNGPKDATTPILMVHSKEANQDYVVAWTHTYGKGKIFATTLGHDMKTAGQPVYPQFVANGLLWTVGKLGADGKPQKTHLPAK